MPQIQGTIENVQGIPGANGRTRYEVTINGQGYNTWKPEIARQANAMLGQSGIFNVTVKPSQDGQFTNYYFDGIGGVQPELGGGIPMQPGAIPMQQQPMQGAEIPMAQAQPQAQYARDMSPQAVARITKLSCLQSANNFVGQLWQGAGPEAMEAAEEQVIAYAKRLYVQVMNAPQTLDDEVVEALVAAAPEQPADETESWV
jgi:hypothetical protein